MVVCPKCRQDICVALVTDQYFDGAKQSNGLWTVPLVDLVYLEDGCTEHEGDRLLWGQKHTFEQAINDHLNGISQAAGLPAVSAIKSPGP
jgi:hypothetical protein